MDAYRKIMSFRVVVYGRKSSKDSDEKHQKHSLQRQERDTKEYFARDDRAELDPTKKLKWKSEKDVDWFYEDASAKKPGREKFNMMLEEIKKGKFDILFCTDLSRLSRNATDNGRLIQLLDPIDKYGNTHLSEIRTLDKSFKNTPADKFTLNLFLAVAKFDNDQRSENTKSGLRNKRSKGGTGGKAPIGYKNEGENKGEKWVEKDEPNYSICRELWDMLLSETYKLEQIYSYARNQGLKHLWNKEVRNVTSSTIRSMFSSQYYTGKIKNGYDEARKEIWTEGSHPAMVTEEEFWEAQAILQRMGYVHAKIERSYDLGSLIKGITVSGTDTFTNANGETIPSPIVYDNRKRLTCSKCKHRFYDGNTVCSKCNTAVNQNTKCSEIKRIYHSRSNRKSVKLENFISWLNNELSKLHITEKLFQILTRQLYTLWLDEEKEFKKELQKLKEKESKLDEELGKITRKKISSDESPRDISFAIESCQSELESTQEKVRLLRESHTSKFEIAWQRLQVLGDAKEILNEETEFEPKKSLLLSLCSNLKMFDDHVEVVWREPFASIIKSDIAKNKKSGNNATSSINLKSGSRGRIRTDDQLVNSQLLYH